ncbi:MAG: hypothetical protein V3W31_02175, partial [Thermodesulfobacteriota bacterium]
KATVTFKGREPLVVEGEVVRIKEDEIAVYLSKGIPIEHIKEEQKYLSEKYGRPLETCPVDEEGGEGGEGGEG